jgi:hypothetical protein
VRKPWQVWWILLERKKKWQEKFDEVGPVSAQSDTCFFGPKSVIFKHIHFSFEKTHQKNVKFCTIGAYVCVFKRTL